MPILSSRFGTPRGPQREDLDLAASAGSFGFGRLSGMIWIWRPQREDLDLAASAGRFGFGGKGNQNNNNQRFRWQEPPGKIICVLFCFDTRRDEEKETQNINDVGNMLKFRDGPGVRDPLGDRKSGSSGRKPLGGLAPTCPEHLVSISDRRADIQPCSLTIFI